MPKQKLINKKSIIIFLALVILIIAGLIYLNNSKNKIILFETSIGNFTVEMFDKTMPITTSNFEKHVEQGFYDNTIFHRVVKDFVIQGGDPTGLGVVSYAAEYHRIGDNENKGTWKIPDEFTSDNQNNRGTIAMANSGKDTGGSQFFINLQKNNFLDDKHPVFGRVVEGLEVVDAIGRVETNNDKPAEKVTIYSIKFINVREINYSL